jgi:hypothetical protein
MVSGALTFHGLLPLLVHDEGLRMGGAEYLQTLAQFCDAARQLYGGTRFMIADVRPFFPAVVVYCAAGQC